MKKILSTLVLSLVATVMLLAQAPQTFSYQTVVRDNNWQVIQNQSIGVQVSIIEDLANGSVVYVEEHTATTNDIGLINLAVGGGTVATGLFSNIDWGNHSYFMKISVDVSGGTNYVVMGTTQLRSVPYALFAETSNNAGPQGVAGNDGVDGTNGTNGVDGTNGTNGVDGVDGTNGTNGVDGVDGVGIAQTLTISGDTLFISSGNSIVIPGLSLINSLIMQGCTNPAAFNYDASANTDDSTCIAVVNGCTDSTAYSGYNPLANTDDGSCVAVVNGCTDPTATNYNAAANTDDGSCTYPSSLAIGDTHQGGIIFYLDGNGGGLIAAPSDQSTGAEWGCFGTLISGADGTAIGTGNQNTIDIEAGCTTVGTAADICANYTDGTYSDWFLPSKDELNQMWLNLHLQGLGGFANYGYWSSTENGINMAWVQGFGDGVQSSYIKYNANGNVRAIRAF